MGKSNASFYDTLNALPVTSVERVIGKFIAAWTVCGIALMLNFPLVIAVNYLGTPDNTVIASQFLASWLLAGSYLSVGCFICVLANQRLLIFFFTLGLLLTDLFFVPCLIVDKLRYGRIHPAFLWGIGLLMLSQIGRLLVMRTDAWLSIATWLIR